MNRSCSYCSIIYRIVISAIVLFIVVGTIAVGMFAFDVIGLTNFTGIHSFHPDEISTKEWIEANGGSALRNDFRSKYKHIHLVIFKNKKDLTDQDLIHLKKLTQLQKLDLSYSGITDKAIPFINELKTLCELDLSGTQITDKGLKLLSLPELRSLDLNDINITDEGLSGLIEQCPKLKSSSVINTSISLNEDNIDKKKHLNKN